MAQEIRNPDEAFLAAGLLKPITEPSGKSRQPNLDAPISFAFRMRHLFGLGTRAEVVRYFVTALVTDAPAQVVTEAAAYAKRNVNETLASLAACRVATVFEIGNERRYYLNRGIWGELLGLQADTWPTYREWPRLLGALRRLVRWLEDQRRDQLSRYMLASEARTLMEDLEPDLAFAGVALSGGHGAEGEQYWGYFVESVERALSTLRTGWA